MTDRSHSRLRRCVLGVVVLVVATWAVVRLRDGVPAGSAGLEPLREASSSRAEGPMLSPPGARTAPPARAAAPTPVAEATPAHLAPLLVRVRAEGVPVPGALVSMYRPNPAGEGLGLEFGTDALGAEQADARGTAQLTRDADGLGTLSQLILCVDVDGYQPSRLVVPAAATEATIDLQRGLRITGVVETSSGRPVSGLRLHCVPWQHAGLRGNAFFQWGWSPSTRRARTDDRGAFTIEGLAPGRHALRATSPATQLRTRGSDRHATPFLRLGVPALAGGPEQRLVAEALGVVLLHPVDAATGESLPLCAGGGNVIISVPGRRDQPLQREPYELQFGQETGRLESWLGPYNEDDLPSSQLPAVRRCRDEASSRLPECGFSAACPRVPARSRWATVERIAPSPCL